MVQARSSKARDCAAKQAATTAASRPEQSATRHSSPAGVREMAPATSGQPGEGAMNAKGEHTMSETQDPAKPVLKVINPDATPEEVAAIVAVFSAIGSSAAPAPRKPRSLWAAPRTREPLHAGPGAWRASALPR